MSQVLNRIRAAADVFDWRAVDEATADYVAQLREPGHSPSELEFGPVLRLLRSHRRYDALMLVIDELLSHGVRDPVVLRYFGQAFEVRVPVPEGPFDASTAAAVADAFHAEHRALYGYDFSGDPSQQVEWVNLRVSGIGPIQRPDIQRHPVAEPSDVPAEKGRRQVCFEASDGYVETPVLWRPDLAPGTVVDGPAIIEEFGSTVPLHPGFTARIDEYLNIIVTRSN